MSGKGITGGGAAFASQAAQPPPPAHTEAEPLQAAEPPPPAASAPPEIPSSPSAPQMLSAGPGHSGPAPQALAEAPSAAPSTPQVQTDHGAPAAPPPQAVEPQAALRQQKIASKSSKSKTGTQGSTPSASGGTASSSAAGGGSSSRATPSASLVGASGPGICQQAEFENTSIGAAGAQPPNMLDYLDDFQSLHIPDVAGKKQKKSNTAERERLDVGRFFDTHIDAMKCDMEARGLLDGPEYSGVYLDLNPDAHGVLAVRPAIDNMTIFVPPGSKVQFLLSQHPFYRLKIPPPCTLHPAPSTLNPDTETLQPEPPNLNPDNPDP